MTAQIINGYSLKALLINPGSSSRMSGLYIFSGTMNKLN